MGTSYEEALTLWKLEIRHRTKLNLDPRVKTFAPWVNFMVGEISRSCQRQPHRRAISFPSTSYILGTGGWQKRNFADF